MARAYRKKPVVVEAVQWTGENRAEMCEFIDPEVFEIKPKEGLIIHTLEGDHHASPGDYIIKGVNGEFYPCKPDIFAKTYEPATLTPQNEALTIEELREMDGEPVWVEFEDGSGGLWGIVHITIFEQIVFANGLHCTIGKQYYGKSYKPYRRPPEGEANERE